MHHSGSPLETGFANARGSGPLPPPSSGRVGNGDGVTQTGNHWFYVESVMCLPGNYMFYDVSIVFVHQSHEIPTDILVLCCRKYVLSGWGSATSLMPCQYGGSGRCLCPLSFFQVA